MRARGMGACVYMCMHTLTRTCGVCVPALTHASVGLHLWIRERGGRTVLWVPLWLPPVCTWLQVNGNENVRTCPRVYF